MEQILHHATPFDCACRHALQRPQPTIRRAIGALASTVRLWNQKALQRRALRALDDEQLHDIGVSRKDAEHEARKPFWT